MSRRFFTGLWGNSRGYTLTELVVVMPMLSLVLGGLIFMVNRTMHYNGRVTEATQQQADTRAALNALMNDLRQSYGRELAPIASFSPSGSAGASQITFYSPDRTPMFYLRKISYRVLNRTLQRQEALSTNTVGDNPPWTFGATGPWVTVLTKVVSTNPFKFYDGQDPPTQVTDPAQAAVIESIVVTLQVSSGGTQAQTYTFTDSAAIRRTQ